MITCRMRIGDSAYMDVLRKFICMSNGVTDERIDVQNVKV